MKRTSKNISAGRRASVKDALRFRGGLHPIAWARTRTMGNGYARNTVSMTVATLVLGVGGLIFWILATHLCSLAEVGVATTIMAALSLLTFITSAGWPQLAVRFGSSRQRGRVILLRAVATSAIVGSALTIFVGLAPDHFGIALNRVHSGVVPITVVTAITVVAGSIGSSAEGILVSRQCGHLVAAESLASSITRLGALVPFAPLGAYGLILANACGVVVGAVGAQVSVRFLSRNRVVAEQDAASWSHDLRYVAMVGVSGVVALLPASVIPTVVLYVRGSAEAAYFAVSLSLASALRLFPAALSQSMLAEVGRGGAPRPLLGRAFSVVAWFSLFSFAALVLAARPIASLYGHHISGSVTPVLILLGLSGMLAGGNYLLDNFLLAVGQMRQYTVVNLLGSALVLPLVILGAQFSLPLAACGYIVAEIGYAAAGWWYVSRSSEWRAIDRTLADAGPMKLSGTDASFLPSSSTR